MEFLFISCHLCYTLCDKSILPGVVTVLQKIMSDQRWIKWKQYRSKHHHPNINRRRYMYQKYYILILPMVFIASSILSPLPLHPPSLSIDCQYIYEIKQSYHITFSFKCTSFQASSPLVIWRKTACHGISMKQT